MRKKVVLAFCLFFLFLFAGCGPSHSSALIITPAYAQGRADKLKDEALLALFQDTLYTNAITAIDWVNCIGIETDSSVVFPGTKGTNYVLVTNIQNMEDLHANYLAIFSQRLLQEHVCPTFLECRDPLFLEEDGQLYINNQAGGVSGAVPDFTRDVVITKTADSFEIEVPLTTPNDQTGMPYIFKVINQDGYWVLDTFFYFGACE